MHRDKGCFHPHTNSLSLQRLQFTYDNPPASVPLPVSLQSIYAFIRLSVTACVRQSMKSSFSIGVCKPLLRASLLHPPASSLPFCFFLSLRRGWGWWDPPKAPPSPRLLLWFWVGTGRGNWSLWALQAHPTVGWTESPLRRQLLGHPRQTKRTGGRRRRGPVAANH